MKYHQQKTKGARYVSNTLYNEKRNFKHLTKEKRAQIEILLKQNMSKSKVAKTTGISRSTLYEELKRGTVDQIDTNSKSYSKYCYDTGQRVDEEHRRNSCNPLKLVKAHRFLEYAEQQILKEKLSLDAICGRAKLSGQFSETLCTKTLYNYIDMGLFKYITGDTGRLESPDMGHYTLYFKKETLG